MGAFVIVRSGAGAVSYKKKRCDNPTPSNFLIYGNTRQTHESCFFRLKVDDRDLRREAIDAEWPSANSSRSGNAANQEVTAFHGSTSIAPPKPLMRIAKEMLAFVPAWFSTAEIARSLSSWGIDALRDSGCALGSKPANNRQGQQDREELTALHWWPKNYRAI